MLWSFLGAAAALIAWNALLLTVARSSGRTFTLEIVLRKQHYLQACAQGSVLLYWGWYWRQVYDSAHLIAAQLLFAYAFDMLLSWSRRDTYTLGFGPFPVIFSINLFLWFKPDWFYLQFLMVALGFAAKELIRWDKDGRRAHIFNPSSFPLAVFSLALILTGASDLTWGQDIASTQFYPPHMYLMLFLDRPAGTVLLRRDVDDDVGGGDDVSVRAAVLRGDGHLLLLRFVHPDCGLPRDAPPVHRSVHLAAHRARTRDLRRALRAQHRRLVRAARDARACRRSTTSFCRFPS